MYAIDVSNYTSELSGSILRQWKAAGVGLVIIQAFPQHYHQYAEQRRQMRACAEAGIPFDVYMYDYLADPTWRQGALVGLERAKAEEGLEPRQLWLDEEDTETEQGWPAGARRDAIQRSRIACEAAGYTVGIYTGAWWWGPKTANWTGCADLDLWDSDYDHVPDAEYGWSPYGGWTHRRIKQHIGTSVFLGVSGVDQNVLSVEEAAEITGSEEAEVPIPQEYQDKFGIGPNDIQGLIDNLEGIGNLKYQQGVQAGLDQSAEALEKLARVREIVGAG
jgi:hypothetical protein